MLLPVGHHDEELIRLIVDRMLPSVHRAKVEDGGSALGVSGMEGHGGRMSELGTAGNGNSVRGLELTTHLLPDLLSTGP